MGTSASAHTSDMLTKAALTPVESGMILGLGTGRMADRVTRALAQRVLDERLDLACVCTSLATERLALELGLSVVPFSDVEEVDYLVDGASEVDRGLRMLKGHSGAIARQRMVARVARQRTYIAQDERYVERLGSQALLAVTISPFGLASIRNALRDMGLSGVARRNLDGELYLTDGGGVIFDMQVPTDRDIEQLAHDLDHVAGVIEHGIFLDEADEVLLESPTGEVRRLARSA